MHYIHRFHVQAPLERVAEFHRDSRALRWLTPPPIFVQFHMIQPLSEGSVSEFTMWLGPIPIHWVAVHSNVTTLHGFTDTQTSGPFESWIHKHQFRPVGELSTEIIDEVDAEFGKS
jgi:ligand-binding SRPBCC domain-containing protein